MQGSKGFINAEGELPLGGLSFAVTAAHELKSPLALIRQLALSLEMDTADDATHQLLHQIVLTSDRALRLTTDLSRSARLEDSLFELEPLNPKQICDEVAHELTPLYKARGREIRVASRYRPMLVVANRDLLRRILLNFGDNALHYAESDKPVELYTRTRESGAKIRLSVRDYGPTIPADTWRRLKVSVGKKSQPLHMRPQSSGLGLYVAGQFAGAMNGHIGTIRHHNGATFYVDITASRQLSLL